MNKEKIKDIIIQENENKLLVLLSKNLYEKEAVFAAAYKYTNTSTILIEPYDESSVAVYFTRKEKVDIGLNEIALNFCNEVLDQQVRLDLEKRYGNIKELIYEHAFSPIKNIKDNIKIHGK